MGGYRDLDRVTDRPDPRDRSWHQVARERDRERGWRHRDGERHSRQDDSRRDHRYDDDDRRADGSGSRFVPPPRERGPRRDDEGQYDQREQQRSRDRAEDKSLSGKAASQDSHEPSQPTSTKLTDTEPGEDDGVVEDSEQDMMAAMGFGGFGTTKVSEKSPINLTPRSHRPLTHLYRVSQGTKVEGNVSGSANVKKERTWRQYMNRWVTAQRPTDYFPSLTAFPRVCLVFRRKGGFNRQLDPVKQ